MVHLYKRPLSRMLTSQITIHMLIHQVPNIQYTHLILYHYDMYTPILMQNALLLYANHWAIIALDRRGEHHC